MAAGREVVQVEGRSRGLVKPHTFFEVDDERIDDRAADEAAGLAAATALFRLGTVTIELCIFPKKEHVIILLSNPIIRYHFFFFIQRTLRFC